MIAQIRLATGIRQLKSLTAKLVDAVLPAQCISCHQLTREPGRLCFDCWDELSFIDHPLCDRMGTPFAFDPGKGIVSARALAQPPVWSRARAAVEFNDMSRKLIHALKYHDRHEVAGMMSQSMNRAGSELLATADLIIPVPLYRFRQWQRRFNQSAALARQIAIDTGIAYQSDILLRSRSTRQQVGLKGAERRNNVKGAFVVDENKSGELHGAKVVLVDDVITTGATVGACSQALLTAGCQQVDVLSFALVNNPLQLHI
ncbi:Competence protein F homolog, phosphoribosyltransferase domain; protein YhgH required for utilization of DNA as sole source of carbon and energy [hydrothermal vent metagenome]|uniref:Competence protein F homolog, phosphoribosyltransferase domain protein YhgH required for utilization of DNA as sole source of carbon and energy n=1 Tax=hydrothermal vent metagenome TaxID=652676 RepID=A0A3B0RFN6_9ZZZZ